MENRTQFFFSSNFCGERELGSNAKNGCVYVGDEKRYGADRKNSLSFVKRVRVRKTEE